MSKINRENLMATLANFEKELAERNSKEYTYRISRSWPGVGVISDIESPAELVNAWTLIHNKKDECKEAITALQMDDGTFEEFDPKKVSDKYYGFTMEEWEKELFTKRGELANNEKINKLEAAIAILEKNMSEDDKFLADMKTVDDLIG